MKKIDYHISRCFFITTCVFHVIVIAIAVFFAFRYYHLCLQISSLEESFRVFRWSLNDANNPNIDTKDSVSHLVYVYGYYPAGSRCFSEESPLADILEQGRSMTLNLMIDEISKKEWGDKQQRSIDQWVDEYGDEAVQRSYESHKSFWESIHWSPTLQPCQPFRKRAVNPESLPHGGSI